MKTLIAPLLLSLCCAAAHAQEGTRTQASPRVDASRIERNVRLENAVSERRRKVASSLTPEAMRKLDAASRAYAKSLARSTDADDPQSLAEREVRLRFAKLTPAQSNLLSFYVMSQTARRLAAAKEDQATAKEELKEKLDSMDEMSEMESLRLQMVMDRRSKFMSALSNILKKISDTQDSIVQNLK
jgi:hypothetical protein